MIKQRKIKKVIMYVFLSGFVLILNFFTNSNPLNISSTNVENAFADIPPPPDADGDGADADGGDGEL